MTARATFIPYGAQVAFLCCPVYEVLIEGTRGGGKTDALLIDFWQHTAKKYGPYWRGILFRKTYKQLDDVVARSKRWFYQLSPRAKFNGSDYKWVFPDGEELLLRRFSTADDYWDYHGHEYPWIGWEELTNWADISCYDSMKSCSRSSREDMPRKYRSNCNPWGIGHNWVKQYFIDPAPPGKIIDDEQSKSQRVRIRSFVWDNLPLMRADPEYIDKLKSIKNENKRRAWLEGDWSVVAGGIIDDVWEETVHIIKPFKIPPSWRIDRSFDWGSSRPFWVGWWAESDGTEVELFDGTKRHYPRGTLFLVAEWYGWSGSTNEGLRMLAKDVGLQVLERERNVFGDRYIVPGPADTSIFDIENGNCIADDFASVGCYWEPADKSSGSRKQGWERLRTMLGNALEGEEEGLFVFDTCRQWLRTVPVLPRSEKDPDDVDTDAEDHAGDGTRYRVWTSARTMRRVGIAGV